MLHRPWLRWHEQKYFSIYFSSYKTNSGRCIVLLVARGEYWIGVFLLI